MRLSRLLMEAGLPMNGPADPEITGIRIDSRKVLPGDLFLACKGVKDDGSRYLGEAASKGAAAILSEGLPEPSAGWADFSQAAPGAAARPADLAVVHVPDLHSRVGNLFNAWHGRPAEKLEAVAVTGTNGKSTIVQLSAAVLRAAGRKVIALGTLGYVIGDQVRPSELTTPGPDEFFSMLRLGVDCGCDSLVMEMSSHALSQDRVRGVTFARAIFTNLTRDHMDYHRDFEDYYLAKKKLFTEYLRPGGMAILNLDSPYGARLAGELTCRKLTFSRGESDFREDAADVLLRDCRLSLAGTEFEAEYRGKLHRFRSALIGKINLENLLAAVALGFSLELDAGSISRGISDVTVAGRNQVFALPNGAFAVVDYAHTPDALERTLGSLRPLVTGRLFCLFGCGGDRDRTKRPVMGAAAAAGSDRIFLTSDNPRTENPRAILEEVLAGMPNRSGVEVIPDRKEALRAALDALGVGDCLLLAGKGHEEYQIIGREKRHFSDQEEVLAWQEARWSRHGT